MTIRSGITAVVLGSAALAFTAGFASADPRTIPGWPAYIAMGAIGGPNATDPTLTSRGGNDDFGGRPVDVVFKYAGSFGNGDPGIIDPPSNALRMTKDLTILSAINQRAMRVAIVEYMAEMSNGSSVSDFSNDENSSAGSYIMARHFSTLGADALALNDKPVVYNGQNYYGTLILNPDLLGHIQQFSSGSNNLIGQVNSALPAGKVNRAVDQAMCFLTTQRQYFAPSLNKTYTGNPVAILAQMLADGYAAWTLDTPNDPYWNTAKNNLIGGNGTTYSQAGQWFNGCVNPAAYPQRPNFPAGFEGWVQANNWIIRTLSPKGRVTFGWQENMWPASNGFWMHQDFANDAAIAATYSTPIGDWLQANAPSAITTGALGADYVPDYFVFDRYEYDDYFAPASATLYNARSWDNYLTGVGLISKRFDNIPVMLWQIPGGHIPYDGEAQPQILNGSRVFSTAPVYFFGDSNLTANLGNMVIGSPIPGMPPGNAVGAYAMDCSSAAYRCPAGSKYKDYLLYYKGQSNNYNWASGNGRLAFAASNNVFSILWGGGNTTNVIKNFNNPDDFGWLSNKIIAYYQNPTILAPATGTTGAPHDFNGDGKSDIMWRNTSGETGMWLMNGGTIGSTAGFGVITNAWSLVGQRNFNGGDAKHDLLWLNTVGDIGIWFMNGGTILSTTLIGNVGTTWSVVGTGDFDGDGKADILWRNTSGAVGIWFMNGGTIVSTASLGNPGTAWSVVGTGDFDGNGKRDILWRSTSHDIGIWFMNGGTIASTAPLGNVGATWSVAGTGDFDGGGKTDILWRSTSNDVGLWLMNGSSVAPVGLGNVGAAWNVASVGDYNGNGKADILWRSTSHDIGIWFMNGATLASTAGLGNVGPNWLVQNAAAN